MSCTHTAWATPAQGGGGALRASRAARLLHYVANVFGIAAQLLDLGSELLLEEIELRVRRLAQLTGAWCRSLSNTDRLRTALKRALPAA